LVQADWTVPLTAHTLKKYCLLRLTFPVWNVVVFARTIVLTRLAVNVALVAISTIKPVSLFELSVQVSDILSLLPLALAAVALTRPGAAGCS
jgi:hypothetical protein